MAKCCRDEGRKRLKRVVSLTKDGSVQGINHRTIRLTKAFNKYFFQNRMNFACRY